MAMAMNSFVSYFVVVIIISISVCSVFGFDPKPMQDFCVADPAYTSAGGAVKPCKLPTSVEAKDFFYSGLNISGNTNNPLKIALTPVGLDQVPGLNTMGMSMARLDLGPWGAFPPHVHQRATELHIVLEGCLGVGFVTSSSGLNNYMLYEKSLKAGDMFVVPMGLVHYQKNCGPGKTSSYAVLNSQNPGINSVTHAVFGSKNGMDPNYLATTYQLDLNTIKDLQTKTWV